MIWYCSRCGSKCDDDYAIGDATRWNSKNEPDLRKHHVPENLDLCRNCALYLFWSRIFPKGIRIYWDEQ